MSTKLKDYPVWSNFIYMIAGIYGLFIAQYAYFKKDYLKLSLFAIYGLFIIMTGIMSIVYHIHTPSYLDTQLHTEQQKEKHDKWLQIDQGFALGLAVIGVLFFLVILLRLGLVYYFKLKNNVNVKLTILEKTIAFPLFHDPNFYFLLLFGILGIIFFLMAIQSSKQAEECQKTHCFFQHIESYDILHSNWHIFTSLTIIFLLSSISHMYDYAKI